MSRLYTEINAKICKAHSDNFINVPVSSSQHELHVQLVACGVNIPSLISVCILWPPKRIERFQSLLDARPHAVSNSRGVNHSLPIFMQRPLPPEPSRVLCSSAEVFLQRTGNTGIWAASAHIEAACATGPDCCCSC